MARSLGDAWKELNLQLEGRRNLLNQAIRYHTIAARVNCSIYKHFLSLRSIKFFCIVQRTNE